MAPAHDPIMHRLRAKLRARRAEAHNRRLAAGKVRKARKAVAGLEARIAKRQARRKGLNRVTVLDGTPCPLGQKLVLLDARRNGWDGVLSSGDRRTVIARLLRRLGKKTQAELYRLYLEGKGAPANPPTVGTHIRVGDGRVGSYGHPLAWWQEGMDTSAGPQLRAVLRDLGYPCWQPYSNEEWHTNLRANPHDRLIERGLV